MFLKYLPFFEWFLPAHEGWLRPNFPKKIWFWPAESWFLPRDFLAFILKIETPLISFKKKILYIEMPNNSEMKRNLIFGLFTCIILLGCIPIVFSESFYTAIVVNESTKECRVLEGFNPDVEPFIPSGWEKINVNGEQCNKIVEKLKTRNFDQNILDYVNLLDCSKNTTPGSLAYFGVGAKDICEVSNYNFNEERFVLEMKEQGKVEVSTYKKPSFLPIKFLISLFILLVLIIFLFLIMKKKRRNRF